MDRLHPNKPWHVNLGDHLQDAMGVNLLRFQGERPSSTRFQETQLLRLSCADVEDGRNQEPCFDLQDLNAALLICSSRKSPGFSCLRYEHLRLFHAKGLQALIPTLGRDFRNSEHSRELLVIHINRLPKKPRKREVEI